MFINDLAVPLHPNRFGKEAFSVTSKQVKMIDNEEILIRQTECLGMMHELKKDIRNMQHTLYSVKGQLSFSEARKYLGVTQLQLNELVREKVIQCIKVSTRRVMFNIDDLDEFLESQNDNSGKENCHD